MANLHYQIIGTGEPVVILHGLFGSGKNWNNIAKILSDHFQVITVDLRNHGNSEHVANMHYEEMAMDVSELMDKLGIKKINLIGHSMGGKVAMGFALNFPEKLSRLIVMDVAPVTHQSTVFEKYIEAMQLLPLAELSSRNEASTLLESAIPDLMVRQFLLQNLARTDAGFVWRFNLQALQENLLTLSKFPHEWLERQYIGPTCFVAGANSTYIKDEHHPLIHKLFPNVLFETVVDAGHWVHAEQPQKVIEIIKMFLSDQMPLPAASANGYN